MSGRVKRRYLVIISMVLFCASAMSTHPATSTVTNTNNNGPGSLRQALADANDGDLINFAVTGTIVLTSGGLGIEKRVTISGPGADQLSIDGNQAQGQCVFGVARANAVTISGLTITNGQCGIYNDHGTLTVIDCVVTGNSGFGLRADGSFGPQAERGNDNRDAKKISGDCPYACLTIANSIISDNSGPGVDNFSAIATILNSTLTGNSAGQDPGYGGGVNTGGGKLPGNVTITNSTISGNSAFYGGGGIASGFSVLTIVNSTISSNSVGDPNDGYGGGIAAGGGGVPPALTITNSTVSGNSAATCGGVCGGTVEIANTILTENASGNIGGTVTSLGYNICSDNGGGLLNGPGDQINTDPLLGPLQDNGGPTLTHLPLPGSPAIDAGDPNFTPPPSRDQRGPCFHRVFGRRIDIGSVETQPRPRCVTPVPRPAP